MKGKNGVVAAAHPLAAEAGLQLLAEGGNAFDAAAATAAALNVAEPFMSGLAGIGQATCFVAAEQRVRVLDFVTRAPAGIRPGAYQNREQLNRGAHAVATPGSLAGWCELVRAHGSKSLKEIFAPAIALARTGFTLTPFSVGKVNTAAAELQPLPFFDTWSGVYAGGKGRVALSQSLRQPALAATLEALAEEGPGLLYGGRLGQALVAHVQALGGCVSMEDLLAVRPTWQEPVSARYRDLDVHVPPPPAEAFQYLLTLRILDGFDLARLERNGVEHLDLVWRAIRLAAGERITHNKPKPEILERLLSAGHVEELRARVVDGLPIDGPTEQWLPAAHDQAKEHTTSFSVADRFGNVICLTQSLGSVFGSGVVVPGTGVCLNNGLYWTDVDPRATNALLPHAELAFPTAPSIATRAGRPVLALGTPGSYGIPQTQAQTLVQHVDFGLDIQSAIGEPRARLLDGRIVGAETRIAADVLARLAEKGHDVQPLGPLSWLAGGMQGVAIDVETGVLQGGADPRRDGQARAF